MNGQIHILLYILNDPDSERFDVDRMPDGTSTRFGTLRRNQEAEQAALRAGLAPGQVRHGLRMLGSAIEAFEGFIGSLDNDIYFVEPLYYHNAVIFERYGFAPGRQAARTASSRVWADGDLFACSMVQPSRQPKAAGASGCVWAIHDGLLGAFHKRDHVQAAGEKRRHRSCAGLSGNPNRHKYGDRRSGMLPQHGMR
jgi:hypothetical protein